MKKSVSKTASRRSSARNLYAGGDVESADGLANLPGHVNEAQQEHFRRRQQQEQQPRTAGPEDHAPAGRRKHGHRRPTDNDHRQPVAKIGPECRAVAQNMPNREASRTSRKTEPRC